MDRISRLGFWSGLVAGGVVVGVIWLATSGAFSLSSSSHLPYGPSDIASIHLQPVPEGPSGPNFLPHPRLIQDMPLSLLGDLLPDPLPKPLDQGHGCPGGGDMVIQLKNGNTVTYGPCRLPWQMSELWGAMIQTADLTEPGGSPNRATIAQTEQARQALAVALDRHPIGKKKFAPVEVSCTASAAGATSAAAYLCTAVFRSQTGAAGVLHRLYCAAPGAGGIIYAPAPANGVCTGFVRRKLAS